LPLRAAGDSSIATAVECAQHLAMYAIVWRFTVRPGCASEFEQHCGPDGAWAALFHKSEGYRGTRLYRDVSTAGIYVTVDQWESEAAFSAFLARHRAEYDALDRRFAALAVSEEPLTPP
jgi:heme-degrading monooxygenase HmoA